MAADILDVEQPVGPIGHAGTNAGMLGRILLAERPGNDGARILDRVDGIGEPARRGWIEEFRIVRPVETGRILLVVIARDQDAQPRRRLPQQLRTHAAIVVSVRCRDLREAPDIAVIGPVPVGAARYAKRQVIAQRHVEHAADAGLVKIAGTDFHIAQKLAEFRRPGNEVQRPSRSVATAQRALRPEIHLDRLQVEIGIGQPLDARDIDVVEMRRDVRIAKLGILVCADAAQRDVDRAIEILDAQTGQRVVQILDIDDADPGQLRRRQHGRSASIALQRLRTTLGGYDDVVGIGLVGVGGRRGFGRLIGGLLRRVLRISRCGEHQAGDSSQQQIAVRIHSPLPLNIGFCEPI